MHIQHIYNYIHRRIRSRILRMGGEQHTPSQTETKTNKLKIVQSENMNDRQLRQTLFSSRWRTRVISNEIVN